MYLFRVELHGLQALDKIKTLADTRGLARRAFPQISETITQWLEAAFEAEGIPPWHPLAEATIYHRLSLGFGAGPILYRTGSLFASLTEASHGFHIREVVLTPQHSYLRQGSSDPRALLLSEGDPEANLPARPIFPPADEMADDIYDDLMDYGSSGVW